MLVFLLQTPKKPVVTPKTPATSSKKASTQRSNRAARSFRRNEKTELKSDNSDVTETPKAEKKTATQRKIADESATKSAPEDKAEKQKGIYYSIFDRVENVFKLLSPFLSKLGDEPKVDDETSTAATKTTKTEIAKPVADTKDSNSRTTRQIRN